MSEKLKRRHLQVFKKNLEERVTGLRSQKDELQNHLQKIFSEIDEVCTEADDLIKATDGHKLKKKYKDVMQMLERCCYNCTVITATVVDVNENGESELELMNRKENIDEKVTDESVTPKVKDDQLLQKVRGESGSEAIGQDSKENTSISTNLTSSSVEDLKDGESTREILCQKDPVSMAAIKKPQTLMSIKSEIENRLDVQELNSNVYKDLPVSFCSDIISSNRRTDFNKHGAEYSNVSLPCSEGSLDFDNIPCSSPVKRKMRNKTDDLPKLNKCESKLDSTKNINQNDLSDGSLSPKDTEISCSIPLKTELRNQSGDLTMPRQRNKCENKIDSVNVNLNNSSDGSMSNKESEISLTDTLAVLKDELRAKSEDKDVQAVGRTEEPDYVIDSVSVSDISTSGNIEQCVKKQSGVNIGSHGHEIEMSESKTDQQDCFKSCHGANFPLVSSDEFLSSPEHVTRDITTTTMNQSKHSYRSEDGTPEFWDNVDTPPNQSHAYAARNSSSCSSSQFSDADSRESQTPSASCKGSNSHRSDSDSSKALTSDIEGSSKLRSNVEGLKTHSADAKGSNSLSADSESSKALKSSFEGLKTPSGAYEGSNSLKSDFEGFKIPCANSEGSNSHRTDFEGSKSIGSVVEAPKTSKSEFDGTKTLKSDSKESNYEGSYCKGSNTHTPDSERSKTHKSDCKGSDFEESNLLISKSEGSKTTNSDFIDPMVQKNKPINFPECASETTSSSKTSSGSKSQKNSTNRAKLASKVKRCLEISRQKFGIDVRKGTGFDSSLDTDFTRMSSDYLISDDQSNASVISLAKDVQSSPAASTMDEDGQSNFSGKDKDGSCENKAEETMPSPCDKMVKDYGLGPMVKQFFPVVNQSFHAMVCELNSPWSFYVHPYGPVLDELMSRIQHSVSTSTTDKLVEPEKNMMCLARYKLDNNYYRACVKNVRENMALVEYIDYGNQEEVEISDLQPLTPDLAVLPAQAVFCALSGLAPRGKDRGWTEDEINTLTLNVKGQILICKPVFCSTDTRFPHLVDLSLMMLPGRPGPVAPWNQLQCVNLNLSALMINQRCGRFMPISEQLGSLRLLLDFTVVSARDGQSTVLDNSTRDGQSTDDQSLDHNNSTRDDISSVPNKRPQKNDQSLKNENFDDKRLDKSDQNLKTENFNEKHSLESGFVSRSSKTSSANPQLNLDYKKNQDFQRSLDSLQSPNQSSGSLEKHLTEREETCVASSTNVPKGIQKNTRGISGASTDDLESKSHESNMKTEAGKSADMELQVTLDKDESLPKREEMKMKVEESSIKIGQDCQKDKAKEYQSISSKKKGKTIRMGGEKMNLLSDKEREDGKDGVSCSRGENLNLLSDKESEDAKESLSYPLGKDDLSSTGIQSVQQSKDKDPFLKTKEKKANNRNDTDANKGSIIQDKTIQVKCDLTGKNNDSKGSDNNTQINCGQSSPKENVDNSKKESIQRANKPESSETSNDMNITNISTECVESSQNVEIARLSDNVEEKETECIEKPRKNEGVRSSEGTEHDEKLMFNVIISHVHSPSDFYVHKITKDNGQNLEKIMEDINRTFFAYSKKKLHQMSRDFLPKVKDFCCAKFKDGFYYRGKVVGVDQKRKQVTVLYLDFGERETINVYQLYPLPVEFQTAPPVALWCRLCNIQPTAEDKTKWPPVSTSAFKDLCGSDSQVLSVTVASGSLPPSGSEQEEPLPVYLVDYNKEKDGVCLNLEMVKLGFAKPFVSGDKASSNPDLADEDVPLDWNPMEEDFNSIRNSYKVDIDDPSMATMNYKPKDEKRICRWFNTPGDCWRGERCRYLHIRQTDVITQDKEEVFVWNENQFEILPEVDTLVVVMVSTIISPRHFFVLLPYGKTTLDYLQTQRDEYRDGEENLEDLQKSLNEMYGHGGAQHDLTVYATGQAVAAQGNDNMWYRGKVVDTNSDEEKVKIFFVDFGNTSWVNERRIRHLDPQFLHLPLQAVECFLEDVELPKFQTVWSQASREYFRSLVDGKTLVAKVTSRSWNGSLKVNLFDTSGQQDIDISQALVDRGYACESAIDVSTLNASNSNSSQDQVFYRPG